MNVRLAVYESLNRIYQAGTYSNLEVNHILNSDVLASKDKALYTTITYGVIQNDIYLDYCVRQFTKDKKVTKEVRTLLKMGYYQMYFMDKIPSYAIVNEEVEIAKQILGIGASKFVNAVLHRMLENEVEIKKEDFKSESDYYALKYSIPTWLYKMIEKHYGSEAMLNLAKSSKLPPDIYCRVNTLRYSGDKLSSNKDFIHVEKDAYKYIGNNLINSEELKLGYVVIQDLSAINVSYLLDVKEDDLVLDMCAAPGSKTTHIAALMNNKGKIIANDIYEQRVELIKHSIKHLGVKNVECICADATKLDTMYGGEAFDKILLDAPCSGFGVIRRKPDILLKSKQEGLDELISLQSNLLDEAYKLLKHGGTLVYSTCTMNKKENVNQISEFIVRHMDMKLVEDKQVLPSENTGDGFYMAKLVKE